MGNCQRKKAKDSNHPVENSAQPSTGVGVIQISRARRASKKLIQERRNTSVSSHIFKENSRKDERRGLLLQEISSNSQKEKRSENLKHDLVANQRDWAVSKLNKKDGLLHGSNLNCFCYSVLRAATHKFSDKNLIGQGGFGDVYIGYINLCTMTAAKPNGSGCAVAVKRLRRIGAQGFEEWENELRFLSRLNHPNVVKLIGFCSEGERRILVYEYMSEGSLEAHLLSENNTELNWSKRIKIAIGAARGLAYLHTHGKPVIHRDLKASNVLLDADLNSKLSDFGLAKFGPQGSKSHVSTRVLGTRGYFAPEYIATGHLTLKTDVYSFGVVLLEIFSGSVAVKKISDRMAGDLVQWAKPCLNNKLELHHVIDKKLGRINVPMEEAHEFAEIILRCLSSDSKSRPMMTEVVSDLERLQQNLGSYLLNSLVFKYTKRTSLF